MDKGCGIVLTEGLRAQPMLTEGVRVRNEAESKGV